MLAVMSDHYRMCCRSSQQQQTIWAEGIWAEVTCDMFHSLPVAPIGDHPAGVVNLHACDLARPAKSHMHDPVTTVLKAILHIAADAVMERGLLTGATIAQGHSADCNTRIISGSDDDATVVGLL